ncbi:hypothetical protein Bbelb_177710 [Branchiostoma belcheri]|nr:hypothetical protein Bbelb_177710 [Branchiostoma belcheri]
MSQGLPGQLSNEEQLWLLTEVKENRMTQDEAVQYASYILGTRNEVLHDVRLLNLRRFARVPILISAIVCTRAVPRAVLSSHACMSSRCADLARPWNSSLQTE